MEKFVQEVLIIFLIVVALVALYHVFIFIFWMLLIALGITVIYRIIRSVIKLFTKKSNVEIINRDDL